MSPVAPAAPPDQSTLRVFGILNVTPDSFSDGGRYLDPDRAVERGLAMWSEGADFVDVGGESTRPGAEPVSADEELRRVLPVVAGLAAAGVAVSIDTTRALVAEAAIANGARVVNDVSGGTADIGMAAVVAASEAEFVLMHSLGASGVVGDYGDVVADVRDELARRIDHALASGVPLDRIVIDPGIGFSKTAEHNWALLRRIDEIATLGRPVLVGASRKRFLRPLAELGDGSTTSMDLATAALTARLAASGAVWAVRVHAVTANRIAAAVEARWSGQRP